jgi:hypothetical protein
MRTVFFTPVLAFICALSAAADVDSVMSALTSEDAATRKQAEDEAAAIGAPMVAPVCALMAEGTPMGVSTAEGVLFGIAGRASEPGNDSVRAAVLAALVSEANGSESDRVRGYATRMLGLVGGDEAVAALVPLLEDPLTFEEARRALERMPGDAATRALILGATWVGSEQQVAIVRSLGTRRDAAATDVLIELAENASLSESRVAAVEALGTVGDAEAAPVLAEAALDEQPEYRDAAVGALIAMADAQEQAGGPLARRCYRRAYDCASMAAHKTAALIGLADTASRFDRIKWLLEGLAEDHTRPVAYAQLAEAPRELAGGPILRRLARAQGAEREALEGLAEAHGLQ